MDYVNLPGSIVNTQPTNMMNTQLYGFILKADKNKLQKMADDRFSAPSNEEVRYMPVSEYVFVTYTHTGKLQSTNPEAAKRGGFAGVDVTFWILSARADQKKNGEWKAEELAWFVPYIFVDTALSLAPGVEIFGYPKTIGSFKFPTSPEEANLFSTTTYCMKKFGENAMAENIELFNIKKTEKGTGESFLKEVWTDREIVLDKIKKVLKGDKAIDFTNLEFMASLAKMMVTKELPIAFLKQFRSIENGNQACYQAIVESSLKTLEFRKAGVLDGKYELSFNHSDQFPIAESLGLENNISYPVFAIWADADLRLEDGKEIWNASKKRILDLV